MKRYYVELKDNRYFYVYAYNEEQVRDIFDDYELLAVDQTD